MNVIAQETPATGAKHPARPKTEVLLSLLQIEPDTLRGLTDATGWGEQLTHHALLTLVVDRKVVVCKRRRGHFLYALRPCS